MSLRAKITAMLAGLLLLIAVFAFGTLLIFEKMTINMGTLQSVSEEHKIIGEMERKVSGFLEATNEWGLTGLPQFKKLYQMRADDLRVSFSEAGKIVTQKKELRAIKEELGLAARYASFVINSKHPVGDPEVHNYLQQINHVGGEILDGLERMRQRSINDVMNVAVAGNIMKRDMTYYLAGLIAFSSFMALFLILRVRRTVAEPFHELLRATERISKGELSYRIGMNRKDEFGILAARFNNMVADLESSNREINRKLAGTELILDVARIAGTTLELKEALALMTDTIAARLRLDSCVIYMLRPEMNDFCLEATNKEGMEMKYNCLSSDSVVIKAILSKAGPVAVEEESLYKAAEGRPPGGGRSCFGIPIIRDNICKGILFVMRGSARVFSEDDKNTLMILVHTIGSVAQNAELYQSTKRQLQRLTVLYELSRAVTSVLDLRGLLTRTAQEITRLLSSRGCIIRLLENGRLTVKSHVGIPEGAEDEMELPLGSGIAGTVAQSGRPMLVEDVSKLSGGLRVPRIKARSVICVPLKVGEAVIGTLGLFDKIDEGGNPVPYTADDLNTVEGFALISSIAIDKSKIYENEVKREREASEARRRMDILFDSVQGGIITLDRDYTIISANRYVEDWVNMTDEELVGRNCLDIFHDKIGICPHCAAKATFETGEINSIMQSRGVNYAELTAYPVKTENGKIEECVVFILDITERVLYQEETLSLYREVIQTKEYLESIIDNSADAIVTTDLDGMITSWNQGAEKTFGFSESNAMGNFLPFIPDFLSEKEKAYMERIRKGEVLKDIETLRRKKDGTIIEVSLTLSPIKDAAGEVIGISGISRDISEKKNVEKELIRRNQELSRLFFISSAMRGTLELDKLLRMVLVAVTMSDGMGFNRAILFLVDEARKVLKGAMGVGPASPEEAWKIWDELSVQKKTLDEIMQDVATQPLSKDSFLDRLAMSIEIPVEEDTLLTRTVREGRSFNVTEVKGESAADLILIQQLGTQAYAVVPLVSRDKVIGVIWVDNYFNRKPITDEDMKFLASFSNHVASAIENARLFEKVKMAEQQLENIFESMSDMVYFNSKDYVIQSVNKAVSSKLGLPPSEIIGKKCYEVFHGMHEPYEKCPHHKTVNTKKAYIEELDDPYMGGTFLTSSSPIFDLAGEFIGSVHVVRDITEIKNLQQKLVMAEKMAALGEVAAKVAHEIRNPLVSVGGFAKRLEKKLDGNLKEYAGIIVKEVERLEGILREILGFVKEVRLNREMVNLNYLVDDVVTLMESDMHERGISLFRDYGLPAEVFIDPNRVKEAIMNIVNNAVQSMAGSGSIYVRTETKGDFAVVEIKDTGAGITDWDRQFIFNPFYTTKAAGTGLGLAITNRIIQEHNGRIELESEIGKGSTFKVFIPLKEEER
ncbi:MAG: PAS domain S-box protein [Candidatus Sulfobium sp.]